MCLKLDEKKKRKKKKILSDFLIYLKYFYIQQQTLTHEYSFHRHYAPKKVLVNFRECIDFS